MKDIVITILQKWHILQKGQYLWEYLCGYLTYIFRCFRSDLNSKFTHDFKDLANFVLKHPEKLENSLLIKTEKRLLEKVNHNFQACCSAVLNTSLIENRSKRFWIGPEDLKEILNKILPGPEDLKEILRPEYIVPRGSSPSKSVETEIKTYTKERMESDKFPDMLRKDINNGIQEIFVAIEEFFLLNLMSPFEPNEDGIYDQKSLKKKLEYFWNTKKECIPIKSLGSTCIHTIITYAYWNVKRFKWNLEQEDFVKNLRIKVDRDRCKKQEKFAYKISIECDIYDVEFR